MIWTKWRLGWRVFGRLILFAFALFLIGLLLRFCFILAITPEVILPPAIGKPVALVLSFVIVGFVMPLGLFWAANWTGYLQGSDQNKFKIPQKKR